MTPQQRGSLVRLRFLRSRASRQAALDTVAQRSSHLWVARVGGPVRGRLISGTTRASVVAQVHGHYNAALLKGLNALHARQP